MIYKKDIFSISAAWLHVIAFLFCFSVEASASKVVSVTSSETEEATTEYTIYFLNTEGWTPYIWAWNDKETCVDTGSYPGEAMTLVSGSLYSWTAPEGKVPTGIIISDMNTEVKAGGGNLTFVNGTTYFADGTYVEAGTPVMRFSPNGGNHAFETLEVTAYLYNATSGSFKVGDDGESTSVSPNSSTTFTIGEGVDYGSTITVSWSATNEDGTTATGSLTFTKEKSSQNRVIYCKKSEWSGAPKVYSYDEANSIVSTPFGAWPGKQMAESQTVEGWYEITLTGSETSTTRFIFYYSGDERYPADKEAGILLDIDSDEAWFLLSNHKWYSYNPDLYTEVSVNEDGIGTYSHSSALDFSDTRIEAYIAPESGISGSVVTLQQLEDGIVPASTGIVIKSTDGGACTAVVPFTETATIIEDNCLKAVTSEAEQTVAASNAETYNYLFAKRTYNDGSKEPIIGFFKLTSDTQSSLNKAYLSVSKELTDTSEAKMPASTLAMEQQVLTMPLLNQRKSRAESTKR